jgi:hypothetical protein
MDLKQYKEKITRQLLEDVRKQIEKEHKIATNTYKPNVRNIKQTKKVVKAIEEANYINQPANIVKSKPKPKPKEESDEETEEEGGKMHFLKHMKHFGQNIAKTGKKVVSKVGDQIVNEGSKQIGNAAVGAMAAKVALSSAAAPVAGEAAVIGTEAAIVGAEALPYAPLLLAAGMKEKKVKKTRVVNDKEKRRHALVKEIMSKGYSLPEASKYIKEHNLTY